MLGTYALSAGYYDAYYGQAQKVRTLINRDYQTAFEQVDVIAGPVAPTTAFRLGEHTDDPLAMYLEDIFTLPANLAGVPGIAFPVGFDRMNLPIGMQLMGPHYREDLLIRTAHAYQQITDWQYAETRVNLMIEIIPSIAKKIIKKQGTMKKNLPDEPKEFLDWSWEEIEPYFISLRDYPLNQETVENWLGEWSRLSGLIYERYQRHFVAITKHTNDQQAKEGYERFLDEIFGQAEAAEQKLKEKLLSSGLDPAGFEIPLRNIRAEAEIFREENLLLLGEELKLSAEYDQILGEQTVEWQGEEKTLVQLQAVLQDPDRSVRERSWRLSSERWMQDRQPISCLWIKLLETRMQLAKNAGQPNYRDFRWKKLLRFDYSADDCIQFHQAIEEVVVPAARQLYEIRKKELGVETLRPWDLHVDPAARKPLKPYESVEELEQGAARIFQRVDPQLGEYFEVMRREGLLDLENRKNKTTGGYCTDFPVSGRAFILMNSVGLHEDVLTLLHEGGHAFHVFELNDLPYFQQKRVGNEFAEVASMAMELLAAPYLTRDQGGFYSPSDAARAAN